MSSRLATSLGVVACVVLVAASAGLQVLREQRYPAMSQPIDEERLTLTSGPLLKRLTAGYNALAADVYWIRAIQHYGGTKLHLSEGASGAALRAPDAGPYPLLAPLLDITTTLDPYFNIAYRFGAIFLSEPYPGGAGRPDLAVALLQKGLQARADKWEYMQDIGFVYYWWRRDTETAASWFARASQVPGAPWWLQSLAANTLAQGGDRRSSRLMWDQIRQSAELDWLRRDAERRLLQLQALDDLDGLQRVVDDVAKRGGSPGPGWTTLIERRILKGIPADPVGTPYDLTADGRVRLSPTSPLFPLPSEPPQLGPVP